MTPEIDLQRGEHDNIQRHPHIRRTTVETLRRRPLDGREVIILDGRNEEHVRLNGRRLFDVVYNHKAIAEP